MPNVTLINATDGSLAGTWDLDGAPEQTITDGKSRLYVDMDDNSQIAVVDTNEGR